MKQKIKRISKSRFGRKPDSVERLNDGLVHDTFNVVIGEKEYIFQISDSEDSDPDSLERCLQFYRMMDESNIPVPSVVTETLEEINGREYMIVEKVEGKSGELDINPEKVRNAGRYLAKIHNFRKFQKAGKIGFQDEIEIRDFEEGSLREKVLDEFKGSIKVFRREGYEDLAESLDDFYQNIPVNYLEEFDPVLCHTDFTPDNVIYQDNQVMGIIDFDRACSGNSYHDLVKAANGFWMHDPGAEWDVRETLYEGYNEERGLGVDFYDFERIMRLVTMVNLIAGMIVIDELENDEIEFYVEKISNILEDLQ